MTSNAQRQMTLTDFLLARIAEDDAAANAAHRESMRGHAGPGFARSLVAWQDQAKDVRGRELIDRMTPARVLAECEAKRRIVERCEPIASGHFPASALARGVLSEMGAAYADHPDYREEWRP